MNKHIEVEGGEIAVQNSFGDIAIIPKKHIREVEDMLKDNCNGCIDSYVSSLPKMSDYAKDGTIVSELYMQKTGKDWSTAKAEGLTDGSFAKNMELRNDFADKGSWKNKSNTGISKATPDYAEDETVIPEEPIYDGGLLKEVIVTAEAPQWLKYKREYENENPYDNQEYVQKRFDNPIGREAIAKIDQKGWMKKLNQEGLQKRENASLDYASQQIIKNKPQGKLSRAEWLNTLSDKEEELVKRDPKNTPTLWNETARGLTSLMEQNPTQAVNNILNSNIFSKREKLEMLRNHMDNPIMSKFTDAFKVLTPLSVPSKMVQSAYKEDYSFTDALKGKSNNAGIVEDVITDPLNLVGLGLWSKLSKANKFAKIEDAYQAVKGLSKEDALAKLDGELIKPFKSEINWSKWNKEIPENKDLIQEYNSIEQQAKANGTWMKNSDGSEFKGTPEQFVQQNSKNFEKAFPKWEKTYHGSNNNDLTKIDLDKTQRKAFGEGLYTTKDKNEALSHYTINNLKKGQKTYNPTLHELAVNTENMSYFKESDRDFLNKWNKKSIKSEKEVLDEYYNWHKKNNTIPIDKKYVLENLPTIEGMPDKAKSITDIVSIKGKNRDWILAKDKVKSLKGNNGMFDMTNPNIYKSVVAAIGALEAEKMLEKQKKKDKKQ